MGKRTFRFKRPVNRVDFIIRVKQSTKTSNTIFKTDQHNQKQRKRERGGAVAGVGGGIERALASADHYHCHPEDKQNGGFSNVCQRTSSRLSGRPSRLLRSRVTVIQHRLLGWLGNSHRRKTNAYNFWSVTSKTGFWVGFVKATGAQPVPTMFLA